MKFKKPRWFQKLYNDANLYQLRKAIEWSCLKTGRDLYFVSPEHTSKTCNNCHFTNHNLRLGQREWICPRCNSILKRDENAARNIYELVFNNHFKDSELSSNIITPIYFQEYLPVHNEFFIQKLANRLGEKVVTINNLGMFSFI